MNFEYCDDNSGEGNPFLIYQTVRVFHAGVLQQKFVFRRTTRKNKYMNDECANTVPIFVCITKY